MPKCLACNDLGQSGGGPAGRKSFGSNELWRAKSFFLVKKKTFFSDGNKDLGAVPLGGFRIRGV